MPFSISSNNGRYYGCYETREEAIEAGKAENDRSFWVGESVAPTQPEEWWNAEDWLEHVSCQDEYGGEWAEDWDDSTKDQRAELEAEVRMVMAKWLDKHKLRPRFWNVLNIEKIEYSRTEIAAEKGRSLENVFR